MKNRRIVISAFLCVALLVVAIGYASVSGVLTVKGLTHFNAAGATQSFMDDIGFEYATEIRQFGSNTSATDSAEVRDDNGNAIEDGELGHVASFRVNSLAFQDDEAIIVYTLTNRNPIDAKISISKAAEQPGNAFRISKVSINETQQLLEFGAEDAFTLAAGESVEVCVHVVLDATPTENMDGSFTLYIDVTTLDD